MMKRALKPVLRTVMKTYKKVSRKTYTNREYKRNISQYSYTVIVATRIMNCLAVVNPPSINRGFSTWKTFW